MPLARDVRSTCLHACLLSAALASCARATSIESPAVASSTEHEAAASAAPADGFEPQVPGEDSDVLLAAVISAATDDLVAVATSLDALYLASRGQALTLEVDIRSTAGWGCPCPPFVLAATHPIGPAGALLLPVLDEAGTSLLAAVQQHPEQTFRMRGRFRARSLTLGEWNAAARSAQLSRVEPEVLEERYPVFVVDTWRQLTRAPAAEDAASPGPAASTVSDLLLALKYGDARALQGALAFPDGVERAAHDLFTQLADGVTLRKLEAHTGKSYSREALAACRGMDAEPCPLFWELQLDLMRAGGPRLERRAGAAPALAFRHAGWADRMPVVEDLYISSALSGIGGRVRVFVPEGACDSLELPCERPKRALSIGHNELFGEFVVARRGDGCGVVAHY